MSVVVWRIGFCRNPAPATDIVLASLGYGSTLGHGRWHIKGPLQVVYAGSSRALCQLEKRVHCNGSNPKSQALMRLDLPLDAVIEDAGQMGLPTNWRDDEAATQTIGSHWIESGSSLGLWVPSCIEPSEMNLLINPAHRQYSAIKLRIERIPFQFDPRLF